MSRHAVHAFQSHVGFALKTGGGRPEAVGIVVTTESDDIMPVRRVNVTK